VPTCLVLNSSVSYSPAHTPLLHEILALRPELFAVVGTDCAAWEEAMDWLYIEQTQDGVEGYFCCTTSHPEETLEDVVAFAEQWCDLKGCSRDVKVIEISQETPSKQLISLT
jgi:hypothetical protein